MKRDPSAVCLLALTCASCLPGAKIVGETLDEAMATSSGAAEQTGTSGDDPMGEADPELLELEWTELAPPGTVFQAVIAMPDGGATVTTETTAFPYETTVRRYAANGDVQWETSIDEVVFPVGALPDGAVVVAGTTSDLSGSSAALWRLSPTGELQAVYHHPPHHTGFAWKGVARDQGVWIPMKYYGEGNDTRCSVVRLTSALEPQWETELDDEGVFVVGLVVDEAGRAYLAFSNQDQPHRWWVAALAPEGDLSSITEVPQFRAISRVDGAAHSLFRIMNDTLEVTHHDAQSLVMGEELFPHSGDGVDDFTVDGGAGFVVTGRTGSNTRSWIFHRPQEEHLHRTLELPTAWGRTVATPLPALSAEGSIYVMVNERDEHEATRGVLHKLSSR